MSRRLPSAWLLAAAGMALAVAAAIAIWVATGSGVGGERTGEGPKALPTYRMQADHATYPAVGDVSAAAEEIVVGKVLSESTESGSSPGNDAYGDPLPPIPHTNYSVSVLTVLKGTVQAGDTIVVSLSGGTTPEGEFVLDGAPEIHVGDTAMFFLRADANGRYYPLAGGAAVAPLQADGSYALPPDATGTEDALPVSEATVLGALRGSQGAGGASPPAGGASSRVLSLRLAIDLRARQRLRRALARGLRLRVRCSAPCVAYGRLRLGAKRAKALRLVRKHKAVVVGRGRAANGKTLVVRFTRKAKRRLRRSRRVGLSLLVRARDRAGGEAKLRRRVRLAPKAHSPRGR